MSQKSHFDGCILGLAVGDALGHPTEFLSLGQIYDRYGPEGVNDFEAAGSHLPGTYTDDTQMSIAVAEALVDAGHLPLDELMPAMASRFVEWSQSPDNNRAPGTTCMAGCRNLANGVDWRDAGVKGSKGCGSAMRAAPIGLYYHQDLRLVVEVAGASSRLTHAHPTAVAAAAGAAVAVTLLLDGVAHSELLDRVLALTGHLDDEYVVKVGQVRDVLDDAPDRAMAVLGAAWVGEEAVADALYCFLRTPDDYRRTVLTAANSEGDSDSIACIAGAMSGAYNGIKAIPKKWRTGVENAGRLLDLSERLFSGALGR